MELKMNKMDVSSTGIICPWCPNKPAIHLCPHDPFKLMKENEELKADNISLRGQLQDFIHIKNIVRRIFK